MTSVNVNIADDNSATISNQEKAHHFVLGRESNLATFFPWLLFISVIIAMSFLEIPQPAAKSFSFSPEPLGVVFWQATSFRAGIFFLFITASIQTRLVNTRKVGQEISTYENGKVIVTDIKERISDAEIRRDTLKCKGVPVALQSSIGIVSGWIVYVLAGEYYGLGVNFINLGFLGLIAAHVAVGFVGLVVSRIFVGIGFQINKVTAKHHKKTNTTQYGTLGTTLLRVFYWLIAGVVLCNLATTGFNYVLNLFI
ncbi:conserved membrane hypothetical protein [Vibrio chagasii]|nr:conserved membrane hypothetical protein [Vibrio chagasii]